MGSFAARDAVRWRGIALAGALLAVACAPAPDRTFLHPVLGNGHGIDHATVLTRDLAAATALYADRLGFTVTPQGKYDNGFENAAIYFADQTYLELYGIHDAKAAASSEDAYALGEPDGLMWLILHVGSTDTTARHLRARGVDMFGPDKYPDDDPWYYRLTGSVESPIPGRRIFYIEYNEPLIEEWRKEDPERTARRQAHLNTAESLRSAWIAVRDMDVAVEAYERIGFAAGRKLELSHLRARGREIVAGNGTILLVQASDAGSPVHAFLGDRADAFMGVSIRVRDLAATQSLLAVKAGASTERYKGPHGESITVAPDKAGGAWLEFFQ